MSQNEFDLQTWANAGKFDAYELTQEQMDELKALVDPLFAKFRELRVPAALLFQSAIDESGGVALNGSTELVGTDRCVGEIIQAALMLNQQLNAVDVVMTVGSAVNERLIKNGRNPDGTPKSAIITA